MNLNPSVQQVSLAALTAYNASKVTVIKGFRSDAGGQVDYKDQGNVAHSIVLLPGEVPPIGGTIEIVDTTATALLIFL